MLKRLVLPILTVALLAAGVAPAEALTGRELAKTVKKFMSEATGARVTKATCPAKVTAKKGKRYTCQATFATGDKSPIKVRFNSSTNVTTTLVNFLTQQLEGQLVEGLGVASVACPKTVKIKAGDTFECEARDAQGNAGIVDVTQTGKGRANAKLREA